MACLSIFSPNRSYAPFDASESVSLTRYMHQQETDAVAHLIDPSPRRSVFVSVMQLGTKASVCWGKLIKFIQTQRYPLTPPTTTPTAAAGWGGGELRSRTDGLSGLGRRCRG
jgi:hypothetical protein